MKCPVCNTSGIEADVGNCPQCNADLEGMHLLSNVKKIHKSRLVIAIVTSVLFVVVLLGWILSFILTNDVDNIQNQNVVEQTTTDAKLNDIIAENEKLKIDKKTLQTKINSLEKKFSKKETTYIVKENETLFAIARTIYGNGFKYLDIAKDNQIESPFLIRSGQALIIYY